VSSPVHGIGRDLVGFDGELGWDSVCGSFLIGEVIGVVVLMEGALGIYE